MANEKFLIIPNTQEKIYEGSVVVLMRLPNLKWILHNGYYNYNGKRRRGWYFSAIPSDTQMPVFEEDLVGIRVLEGGHDPFPPCPPFPPGPHPPFPPIPPAPIPTPFTPDDKKQLDAAMITFANLTERDKYSAGWIPDGKVVRVNDIDGQGQIEYYSWNSSKSEWELASLGYRYMTRDEITQAIGDDIVNIVWSNENGALVLTNKAGEVAKQVELTGLAHDPIYDLENLQIRIPVYGKSDYVVNIPKDKHLVDLRFEPEWQFSPSLVAPAIIATVSDGVTTEELAMNASMLMNRGQETSTTRVFVNSSSGEITADVKISTLADNVLKVDTEGMWVDLSGVVAKKQIDTGFLLIADGNGEFTYAGDGVQLEQSTAISDITDKEHRVVTANLIVDAINAAIQALRDVLEARIAEIETRINGLVDRMDSAEGRLDTLESRLDFGEGEDGDVLVTQGNKLVRAPYKVGGETLSEEDDTIATEKAVVTALSWENV